MRNPKVGETLYSLNVGNAARRTPQVLVPVVVTNVGRKYFTVGEGHREKQYYLDDWSEKTNYSATSVLYESEQEWKEEQERTHLMAEIRKTFEYGHSNSRRQLSLAELRDIHKIIFDKVDANADGQP